MGVLVTLIPLIKIQELKFPGLLKWNEVDLYPVGGQVDLLLLGQPFIVLAKNGRWFIMLPFMVGPEV